MLGVRMKGVAYVTYKIEVRRLGPQHTVSIHREVPVSEIGSVMQEAIPQIWSYAASHGGAPQVTFARYFSVDPDRVIFDVGVTLAGPIEGAGEIEAKELPVGDAVYTLYVGPYDGMEPAYKEIDAWIAGSGRKSAGAAWEVYLSDPQSEPDPQKWKTEIYWPIE
jgi:effector-binding domain-containing protein